MFRFHDSRSLADLVELRASLRRQELVLSGALRDVQSELRSWEQHRAARAAAGQRVPRELRVVWDELAERERELALDVLQVQAALVEANREIQARLSPRPVAS